MNKGINVSTMSGKLSGIKAINTNPLTNDFCQGGECGLRKVCYSCKMLMGFRKNCVPSFSHNSTVLSGNMVQWPRFKPGTIVRYNGHGELINVEHAVNLLAISAINEDSTFVLWTKRTDVIQEAIRLAGKPDNFTLIYSSPYLNTRAEKPEFFDKVFTVYTPGYAYDRGNRVKINCGAKSCIGCMLCYSSNRTVYVNEILK